MARLDDAADGLKSLSTHRHAILDAYLNHRGTLHRTDENLSAIKALLKHHLAWQLDPDEPVRLSHSLTSTLTAVTRSYRMSSANLEIGHLWDEIEDALNTYRDAKSRGAIEDSRIYLETAYDYGHQLIESLTHSISYFSHSISTGFTHIHDLELRAKANRKLISKAQEFNTVLINFDYEDLQKKAGTDPDIRYLLLKALPKALEVCRKELLYSIERLTDMLHTLNQQQHTSMLIDVVLDLYQKQETYMPSLDTLESIPPTLNRAQPLLSEARADLANPDHEHTLVEIVNRLPALTASEVEDNTPEPVTNAIMAETAILAVDPIREGVLQTLALLIEQPLRLSASKVFSALKLKCDAELFLMALVNEVYALPATDRKKIEVHFQEHADTTFRDNRWVSDIILTSKGARVA